MGQFNVLAANLAKPGHFPYTLPSSLKWGKRSGVLRGQINTLVPGDKPSPPDILCMEEVAELPYFAAFLEAQGYAYLSARRPSAHDSSWSGLAKEDGTVIFYNAARYSLVHGQAVVFDDVHDRVALAALLADGEENRLLLVASTHLYWNAAKVDTQMAELAEVEALIVDVYRKLASAVIGRDEEELDAVSLADHQHVLAASDSINLARSSLVGSGASSGAAFAPHIRQELGNLIPDHHSIPLDHAAKIMASAVPLVLAGDFNNGPDSEIYTHITSHFLSDWLPSPLVSAYASYPAALSGDPDAEEKEPEYTTYNFKRAWTIDYIFYSQTSLGLDALLSLPPTDDMIAEDGPPGWLEPLLDDPDALQKYPRVAQYGQDQPSLLNGIPNTVYGSDHLPITAVFSPHSLPVHTTSNI